MDYKWQNPTDIKIEKGVEQPEKLSITRKNLLSSMEIGDSFVVNELERGPYTAAAIGIRKTTNDKFKLVTSSKDEQPGYVRIWRTQ